MNEKKLTTKQGVPIADNPNSFTLGESGRVLLQDVQFIEKMAYFHRGCIPESVVHAKGAAHNYFHIYKSKGPCTEAKFLQDPKKKTPVFVRFSTVTGGRASAEKLLQRQGRTYACADTQRDGVTHLGKYTFSWKTLWKNI